MSIVIINRLPYKKARYDEWLSKRIKETILITTTTSYEQFSKIPFKEIYPVENFDSTFEVEELVFKVYESIGIERLIALSEMDILRAGKLRSLLNIEGQDFFSGSIFRDKLLMKQAARFCKINIPKFSKLYSKKATSEFVKEYDFPVVIKPMIGSGSVGVKVFNNFIELENYLDDNDFLFGENYEIEEYIDGTMYHVDGLFEENKILFSSVSKYYKGCLEFQNANPLCSYIVDDDSYIKKEILKASKELLVHLMDGIISSFHLEVIVDKQNNIYLCEVGSRTGGSLLGKTIENKYGVFLNEGSVKRQLNIPFELPNTVDQRAYGFIIVPPKKGRLKSFKNQDQILSVFDYYETNIEIGKEYSGGKDSVDSIFSGILTGKNESKLINKFKSVINLLNDGLEYLELSNEKK